MFWCKFYLQTILLLVEFYSYLPLAVEICKRTVPEYLQHVGGGHFGNYPLSETTRVLVNSKNSFEA